MPLLPAPSNNKDKPSFKEGDECQQINQAALLEPSVTGAHQSTDQEQAPNIEQDSRANIPKLGQPQQEEPAQGPHSQNGTGQITDLPQQHSLTVVARNNQQPQHGTPAGMAAIRPFQQQQALSIGGQLVKLQAAQVGLFSTGNMQRDMDATHSLASQPNRESAGVTPNVMQQQQPLNERRQQYHRSRLRVQMLQASIKELEQRILQLIRAQDGKSDSYFLIELSKVNQEIERRRELLKTVVHDMGRLTLETIAPGPSTLRLNQPSSGLPKAWMSAQEDHPSQPRPAQPFASSQMSSQSTNVQAGTAQTAPQVATERTGQLMQCTVPTPPQLLSGQQNANRVSPNNVLKQYGQMNACPSQPPVQPFVPSMPAQAFASAYKAWCLNMGVHPDSALLSHDGLPVDLYRLHVEVLNAGGASRATANDQWPIIGEKLGFMQSPRTGTEPAKSGRARTQRLQQSYMEHLAAFDQAYLQSVLPRKREMQQYSIHSGVQNAAPGQPAPIPRPAPQNVHDGTIFVQQPVTPVRNSPNLEPVTMPARPSDPQQINDFLLYFTLPVTELRRRGVPDHVIYAVEHNRAFRDRQLQLRRDFNASIAKNVACTSCPATSTRMYDVDVSSLSGRPRLNLSTLSALPNEGQCPSPPEMALGRDAVAGSPAAIKTESVAVDVHGMHGNERNATPQPEHGSIGSPQILSPTAHTGFIQSSGMATYGAISSQHRHRKMSSRLVLKTAAIISLCILSLGGMSCIILSLDISGPFKLWKNTLALSAFAIVVVSFVGLWCLWPRRLAASVNGDAEAVAEVKQINEKLNESKI
ncbi:hypothetical protein AcW1_005280 [Taiwanofungus camphoratus]|nr:hypothetical protein AcV5_005599 [Antrodia cinnamomea]KAI0956652.1 hypothetical protein AcW1_005280 [Antrodia cinnamomea]